MKSSREKKHKQPILVLNSDYLPINITNFKKAYKLIYKGKAEIVKEIPSESRYTKPSIIRLFNQVHVPFRKVILSKDNILKRDKYTCVYCDSTKNLTIDHIHPSSKGGKDTWENLITSCYKCNSKKGDQTLEQCGMKLKYKPYKPNPLSFMCEVNKVRDGWGEYLVF